MYLEDQSEKRKNPWTKTVLKVNGIYIDFWRTMAKLSSYWIACSSTLSELHLLTISVLPLCTERPHSNLLARSIVSFFCFFFLLFNFGRCLCDARLLTIVCVCVDVFSVWQGKTVWFHWTNCYHDMDLNNTYSWRTVLVSKKL